MNEPTGSTKLKKADIQTIVSHRDDREASVTNRVTKPVTLWQAFVLTSLHAIQTSHKLARLIHVYNGCL